MKTLPDPIKQEHVEQVQDMSIDRQLQLVVSNNNSGGSLQDQLAGAAIATVVARMVQLEEQDQTDLFECVKDLSTATSQSDAKETMDSILEILGPKDPVDQLLNHDEVFNGSDRSKHDSWLVWISEKIRGLRRERDWTQNELAEQSALPQSHISRLERGQHSPSHKTLVKLARSFGIKVGELSLEDGDCQSDHSSR